MNTSRGWFLVIGLMFALLLGSVAFFAMQSRKTIIVASNSQPLLANVSILKPSSDAVLTAPTASATTSISLEHSLHPVSTYQYNPQGQLQAIVYPDGSVYTCQYNAAGYKIRETSRTGKTWSYVYDPNGHPLSVIDPEGRVTQMVANPPTSK